MEAHVAKRFLNSQTDKILIHIFVHNTVIDFLERYIMLWENISFFQSQFKKQC